jgi:hypothetical protein
MKMIQSDFTSNSSIIFGLTLLLALVGMVLISSFERTNRPPEGMQNPRLLEESSPSISTTQINHSR